MRNAMLLVIVAASLTAKGTAFGSDPALTQPSDDAHTHRGFFVRPEVGLGFMSSSGGATTISGLAVLGSVHVGCAVVENLILGAVVYAGSAGKTRSTLFRIDLPGLTTVGTVREMHRLGAVGTALATQAVTSPTSDGLTLLTGIGPEVTYYFMPANVYVSATIGLAWLKITPLGQDSASGPAGFGGRVGIGKEWWVSRHWGLGLAAHASQAWNTVDSVTYSTWSLGAVFSATYN